MNTKKHITAPCPHCDGAGVIFDNYSAGQELRERRLDSRKTLAQLAAAMNISQGYLCDLEQGRKKWTPELIASYEANARRK